MKVNMDRVLRYVYPTASFNVGVIVTKTLDFGFEAGLAAFLVAILVLSVMVAINYALLVREQKEAQAQLNPGTKQATETMPSKKLFTHYPKSEPSLKAWGWRLLLGPASLLDGLVEILTLSSFGVSARLNVAKNLAKSRILAQGKSHETASKAT